MNGSANAAPAPQKTTIVNQLDRLEARLEDLHQIIAQLEASASLILSPVPPQPTAGVIGERGVGTGRIMGRIMACIDKVDMLGALTHSMLDRQELN
jgi:hypothetical protein